MHLSTIDRQILELLQKDAALSAGQIGEAIGLSQSQCWRRIEKLQADGVILRRVAKLDAKKLGLNVALFVQIKLDRHGDNAIQAFRDAMLGFDEVVECHTVLGNVDFILKVILPDLDSYERFLNERLSRLSMVKEMHTIISLSELKGSDALPLSMVPRSAPNAA